MYLGIGEPGDSAGPLDPLLLGNVLEVLWEALLEGICVRILEALFEHCVPGNRVARLIGRALRSTSVRGCVGRALWGASGGHFCVGTSEALFGHRVPRTLRSGEMNEALRPTSVKECVGGVLVGTSGGALL